PVPAGEAGNPLDHRGRGRGGGRLVRAGRLGEYVASDLRRPEVVRGFGPGGGPELVARGGDAGRAGIDRRGHARATGRVRPGAGRSRSEPNRAGRGGDPRPVVSPRRLLPDLWPRRAHGTADPLANWPFGEPRSAGLSQAPKGQLARGSVAVLEQPSPGRVGSG